MPTGIYKRKPFTEEHKKNISISLMGNKRCIKRKPWNKNIKLSDYPQMGFQKGHRCFLTESSKEKISEAMKGEGHWNYRGGISNDKNHVAKRDRNCKKNYKKRMRENSQYRINCSISGAIWRALKGDKLGRKWEDLVGYTLQELLEHLEKQLDDKMTWDNYGSYWHIDHRTPQSWFFYETVENPEFRECWALNNLQPLEVKENLIKSNRYIS